MGFGALLEKNLQGIRAEIKKIFRILIFYLKKVFFLLLVKAPYSGMEEKQNERDYGFGLSLNPLMSRIKTMIGGGV